MKNPKGPKLGKRAQALLKKQEDPDSKFSKEPKTAEEFLEQGSIDEESGDRWLGSDLAKSLRFYQKAYLSYLRAIQLQGPSDLNLDSYYNSSRLLFQVYYHYFKADGVNIYDLTNVNEVLTGGEDSVVQSLPKILEAHETSIKVANSLSTQIPLDLLFNTAVVYTEAIEVEQENPNSNFNELLEVTHKTQQLFQTILERQVKEFQKFLQELQEVNETEFSDPSSAPQVQVSAPEESKEEEYTSEEVIQPTDIFETVIASYKLAQSLLENISDENSQSLAATDLINPFLSTCDKISQDLIERFSETSSVKNELVSNISLDQINELKVAKTVIVGLSLTGFDEVFQLWEQSDLPETSERYMSAADNIQSLVDRKDLTLAYVNSSGNSEVVEVFWNSLTKMGNHLKKAQGLLDQSLQEKKKVPSGVDLGLGSLIAQISEVIIARADIDLQRAQVEGHASAEKNKSILLQNAKTSLKNAMNIANTQGGLRERIEEKLQREKKKVDAVIRMCILESKTSVGELDTILGRTKWVNELPNIKKLGYYDVFGVQGIEIPSQF